MTFVAARDASFIVGACAGRASELGARARVARDVPAIEQELAARPWSNPAASEQSRLDLAGAHVEPEVVERDEARAARIVAHELHADLRAWKLDGLRPCL